MLKNQAPLKDLRWGNRRLKHPKALGTFENLEHCAIGQQGVAELRREW